MACPSTVTRYFAFLNLIFVSVIHDGVSVLTVIVVGGTNDPLFEMLISVQPLKLRFWHGGAGGVVGQSGTTVVVAVSV
jgi:hypothetical protein